jgi:hypothetical protein
VHRGGLNDPISGAEAAVWYRPPKGVLARVRWCFLLTAYFDAAIALAMIAASDA